MVLDADLAAATKTGTFKKKFPQRFFDCGIQEGNMMLVAAGIATTGKIPFASTFAMFAACRAFEQIRNGIGYPHLNVKIGATHAGISVGEDGATHQCLEDIATMRTIPGMTIINPADAVETRAAVEAAINYIGPVYSRLGRLAVPVFNDEATYKFEMGRASCSLRKRRGHFAHRHHGGRGGQGSRVAQGRRIDAAVINIHTIKPLDDEAVIEYAKKTEPYYAEEQT